MSGKPAETVTGLRRRAADVYREYECRGGLGILEEVISLHRRVLELNPVDHPDRLASLNNLAHCIQSRYRSLGTLGDPDEAISLNQQALDLRSIGHPYRSSSMTSLSAIHEYFSKLLTLLSHKMRSIQITTALLLHRGIVDELYTWFFFLLTLFFVSKLPPSAK
ncbi:hypothetical protein ID866_10916 [Astraeus odoratus]|nr:hypothetical protein ID866_10916 [Astraeus odoratus]